MHRDARLIAANCIRHPFARSPHAGGLDQDRGGLDAVHLCSGGAASAQPDASMATGDQLARTRATTVALLLP